MLLDVLLFEPQGFKTTVLSIRSNKTIRNSCETASAGASLRLVPLKYLIFATFKNGIPTPNIMNLLKYK